ncbi:hypothetical protein Afe04nite_21500 [Asanoa ferruginea]|uniref:LuxR C-terminal-related transcriptional regulator n=1 Tax=Asanoa ferruginea TaxID=53367 RepID=UPI001A51D8E6|nr:hypothetical protein Afe04nite_21500 [Asanoa ferruginea]
MGASGFPLKDVTAERLFDAVRVVAAGEALLAPRVTRRLIGEFARLPPRSPRHLGPLASLTPRETDVLRLMAEGLSNPEIAKRLVVSDETVKTHDSRLLGKLACGTRHRPSSWRTKLAWSSPAAIVIDGPQARLARSTDAPTSGGSTARNANPANDLIASPK